MVIRWRSPPARAAAHLAQADTAVAVVNGVATVQLDGPRVILVGLLKRAQRSKAVPAANRRGVLARGAAGRPRQRQGPALDAYRAK